MIRNESAQRRQQEYTASEYLSLERASMDIKHEYIQGRIVAMAGASRAHNLITSNLTWLFVDQLKGTPCETYSSDMRVRTASTYTYPDVVVVCGEPEFEDREVDTLLNPTVIVEVLSPSTEAWDRGDKFFHYRALHSLKDYLLVAQDKMRVEHYTRGAGEWTLHDATGPEEKIRVESIGCELGVSEVYRRVGFASVNAEKPG